MDRFAGPAVRPFLRAGCDKDCLFAEEPVPVVETASNMETAIRSAKGFYVPPQSELSLIRARDGLYDSADYSVLNW